MASQVTGERHFYPFLIWDCAAVVKIRSEKFQEMYIFAQFFQNAETFKTERITISPFIVNPLYLITHCFPILHKKCAHLEWQRTCYCKLEQNMINLSKNCLAIENPTDKMFQTGSTYGWFVQAGETDVHEKQNIFFLGQ